MAVPDRELRRVNSGQSQKLLAQRGSGLVNRGTACRGRSHTGGDLVVYLPAQKIMFMSETYLHRMFPSLASGYPSEWIAAIKKAQSMDVTTYIPGHGFVDSPAILKAELDTFRRSLEAVVAEGKRLHDAGVPEKDAEMQARFGEFDTWSIRDMMAPRAIARVYAELDGTLK